jgi:zinc protease
VRLAFNPTISQTTIMMVSSGHKRHDPDRMKCVMLAFLLSKRLNEEVRDKRGYAYSIWSYFNAFDEGGMFAAVTQTKPKSTADSIRIMKNEIGRMMNEPVGDKELSEARDSIINGFAFNFQSKLGICEMSASFAFFKFPENYIEQYYNEMSAMTAAQIQECAKKFLKPDKLRIVVIGNKEQLSEPLNTFSGDYKEAQWQQGTPPKVE